MQVEIKYQITDQQSRQQQQIQMLKTCGKYLTIVQLLCDVMFIILIVTIMRAGNIGVQGVQGENGLQGETGMRGIQGEKGEQGDMGIQGMKGDGGVQGLQGARGDIQNEVIYKGEMGQKGDKGETGLTGLTGLQGVKGDNGDTGATGPKGDRGDIGQIGPRGDKGDTGETGQTGVQGPKGQNGLTPSLETLETKISNLQKKTSEKLYGDDYVIYQNIWDAYDRGKFTKIGTPAWDSTTYNNANTWNSKPIIKIGRGEEWKGNGISIDIPVGFDLLWLRQKNDAFSVFCAHYIVGTNAYELIGKFAAGFNNLNSLSPDGGGPDAGQVYHKWMAIPVPKGGRVGISCARSGTSDQDCWLSGLGFGKNIWNQAYNTAVAYHWGLNGGDQISWSSENWNGDQLGYVQSDTIKTLMVPIIPNGEDKLIYIIGQNDNWDCSTITSISVNGFPIQRPLQTYTHPFQKHFLGRIYSEFLASKIPKEYLSLTDKFITVQVQVTTEQTFYFRSIGTLDYID